MRKAIEYAEAADDNTIKELFGAPEEQGKLFFEDCKCLTPCITDVRPGITINKALGTVMEKRLFFMEKVAMGTRFECKVCGEEEHLNKLKEILKNDEVRNYLTFVGVGDGMVKLVEVRDA